MPVSCRARALEISNLERLREDPSLFKQPGLFRYL